MANVTQQEVKDVVSSGSGLAFIVFPFAGLYKIIFIILSYYKLTFFFQYFLVTKLAGAPFWAVIFFIMMLTLGLDSEVKFLRFNNFMN